MKKEIMELLKAEKGSLRLNSVSRLDRWTVDALGDEVDALELRFEKVNGTANGFSRMIEGRDYPSILEECERATEDFCRMLAERLTKDLKAGYRSTSEPLKIESFKDELRAAVKDAGLSQAKAAEKLGVPLRTFESWLSGERTPAPYVQQNALEGVRK